MNTVCIKHKIEIILDPYLNGVCVQCLIEASEAILANFGISDICYCGHCGGKFTQEEFKIHINNQ
jgi:hypothetical protein